MSGAAHTQEPGEPRAQSALVTGAWLAGCPAWGHQWPHLPEEPGQYLVGRLQILEGQDFATFLFCPLPCHTNLNSSCTGPLFFSRRQEASIFGVLLRVVGLWGSEKRQQG